MLNQAVLVGRIATDPELKDTEKGKVTNITLAVPRSYKNPETGEYDTDFLDCTLWTGIAESTAEYCKKGDIVGVRGRIQSRIIENEDGSKYKRMEIVADKVTFLSSNSDKKNEDNILDLKEDDSVLDDENNIDKEKKKNNKKN